MAALITLKGPTPGRAYPLDGEKTLIGRQPDVAVYLESLSVSRHHAQVTQRQGIFNIEDLGSSNGTFVNGVRIKGQVPLSDRDVVTIGPYEFGLQSTSADSETPDNSQVVRARFEASSSNHTLFTQNPTQKLQVVLEIAAQLGHTLDLDTLLNRLLEHLFRLFPQADRGMVLLGDLDRLLVRAQRTRQHGEASDFTYSRTIVRKALEEGAALLSEDVGHDRNLAVSATMVSLNLRSFLCVPLIGWEDRRLGVLQLDCIRPGLSFRPADLEMLTAIGLQVAVVLQNAEYHAEHIREERFRQEIQFARDIQQQFLPDNFRVPGDTAELFARAHPAREVSGDLYDFHRLPDGRILFFVGDVSGKGMPAALFMIAVRTLSRLLGPQATGPADFLQRINNALTADNPTNLYVTMMCGMYDGRTGQVLLASGGHPPPLLRRTDGKVEVIPIKPALLIGSAPVPLRVSDTPVTLKSGETLIFYTDGFTEGFAPDGTMFGVERLCEALGGPRTQLPLEQCAEEVRAAVRRFVGSDEQQDDQTLLLLRRR
jgi:phosphoserine phosphatase RsbU/P